MGLITQFVVFIITDKSCISLAASFYNQYKLFMCVHSLPSQYTNPFLTTNVRAELILAYTLSSLYAIQIRISSRRIALDFNTDGLKIDHTRKTSDYLAVRIHFSGYQYVINDEAMNLLGS
ncbi:unnamed protein product [Schistosoma curassoni]|uniref:Uncharacterized protein n=1 Tax=Schistosoma curassoni TaxID=6186 RepID=A0A183K5I6_9TREM|nr:unnamed protein product [Schistosoma curassoni]